MHSARRVILGTMLQPGGFGTVPAGGAINKILVPKSKSGTKATRKREPIENDTLFEDGASRPDGLGEFANEQTWEINPNLDWMPFVQHMFMGGADAPAAAGAEFERVKTLSDVLNHLIVEEGYPDLTVAEHWRHRDHVLHKLGFKYALNSILKLTGTSTGSGNWSKEVAPLDATPTKIEGTVCDYSEATITLDGTAFRVIELNADMERGLSWERDSGGSGKATGVAYESFTAGGSIKVYKRDAVLEEAAHSSIPVLMNLVLNWAKGTKYTKFRYPEIQIFSEDGIDNTGEGAMQTFRWAAKKLSNVASPFEWSTRSATAVVA
jgi:hypothetical protein